MTTPTAPTAGLPPASAAGRPALSGLIFESTGNGKRPLPGSRVYYYVTGGRMNSVIADQDGRYTVAPVEEGSRVRITALADPAVAIMLSQRSGTTATIHGDTILDVELVAGDARAPSYEWPALSGVIYRETTTGRQPVANTLVFYSAGDAPLYDAYTATDSQGRFAFGRLPLGPGRLGAGSCNDQSQLVPVTIRSDVVIEVDLTTFFATCPGAAF